eukprot:jgi/Chrzof1/13538/Cz08g01090.t1
MLDGSNRTPLNLAIFHVHTATAVRLLKAGAATEALNEEGLTALLAAAMHGHTYILCALLRSGANVNAVCSEHKTALHYAAECDKADWLRHLVRAGADIEAEDDNHNTPFHAAVLQGHSTTALALLEKGALVVGINDLHLLGRTCCRLFKHIAALQNKNMQQEIRYTGLQHEKEQWQRLSPTLQDIIVQLTMHRSRQQQCNRGRPNI